MPPTRFICGRCGKETVHAVWIGCVAFHYGTCLKEIERIRKGILTDIKSIAWQAKIINDRMANRLII